MVKEIADNCWKKTWFKRLDFAGKTFRPARVFSPNFLVQCILTCVYLLSVENLCISQSVCIFCIFSETWMLPILVLLAMVVYAGIALVFFYQNY